MSFFKTHWLRPLFICFLHCGHLFFWLHLFIYNLKPHFVFLNLNPHWVTCNLKPLVTRATMAAFQQIPKNFRFKPIYPISSPPLSHDVVPSYSTSPHVTKLSAESPPIIVYEDLTWKDLKKKLYEGAKRFQDV